MNKRMQWQSFMSWEQLEQKIQGEKILSSGQWLWNEGRSATTPSPSHPWAGVFDFGVTEHGNSSSIPDPSRRGCLMWPWPNKESSAPLDSSDGVFKSEVERRLQTRGFQLKPSSSGFANYLIFWNVPYFSRDKYSALQLGNFFPNWFYHVQVQIFS